MQTICEQINSDLSIQDQDVSIGVLEREENAIPEEKAMNEVENQRKAYRTNASAALQWRVEAKPRSGPSEAGYGRKKHAGSYQKSQPVPIPFPSSRTNHGFRVNTPRHSPGEREHGHAWNPMASLTVEELFHMYRATFSNKRRCWRCGGCRNF